jgi:hypothetical protein
MNGHTGKWNKTTERKKRNKERGGGRRISRENSMPATNSTYQRSRRCTTRAAACTTRKATTMNHAPPHLRDALRGESRSKHVMFGTRSYSRRGGALSHPALQVVMYNTRLAALLFSSSKERRVLRRLDQISRAVLPARWHLVATSRIPAFKLTIFRPELKKKNSSTWIFSSSQFQMWSNSRIHNYDRKRDWEHGDIFPLSQFCYYTWEVF